MPERGEEPALAKRLVLACRILRREGHEHLCFGHVSARGAVAGRIHVTPGRTGLGDVQASRVVRLEADGSSPPAARVPGELALHVELYRARPDVGAVVHTHPFAAQVVSLFPERWAVACQDAVPFWRRLAFSDQAGLVASEEDGRRLAASLGDARAVLLRAHGIVAVGEDVEEATVNAVLLGRSLRLILAAGALGSPEPIAQAELERLDASFEASREERIRQIWEHLARSLASPPQVGSQS